MSPSDVMGVARRWAVANGFRYAGMEVRHSGESAWWELARALEDDAWPPGEVGLRFRFLDPWRDECFVMESRYPDAALATLPRVDDLITSGWDQRVFMLEARPAVSVKW